MKVKQSVDVTVPVRLLNSSGLPVTSVAHGSVTAVVGKADKTEASISMSGSNWEEANNGLAGKGIYYLTIPASALDVPGALVYCVSAAGVEDYIGVLEVVSALESDFPAAVWATARSGLNVANSIGQGLVKLYKTNVNRAKENASTNQLEIYEDDGTTIAHSYDLRQIDGTPAVTDVTERDPA